MSAPRISFGVGILDVAQRNRADGLKGEDRVAVLVPFLDHVLGAFTTTAEMEAHVYDALDRALDEVIRAQTGRPLDPESVVIEEWTEPHPLSGVIGVRASGRPKVRGAALAHAMSETDLAAIAAAYGVESDRTEEV